MCEVAFLPPAPLCATRTHKGTRPAEKRPRVRWRVAPRKAVRMDDAKGYVPSDEDRPEGASKKPRELTLSQQLLMKSYEEQVERMSKEEAQALAMEVARQMLVKDNILKAMTKQDVDTEVGPLDPRQFMESTDGGGGGVVEGD